MKKDKRIGMIARSVIILMMIGIVVWSCFAKPQAVQKLEEDYVQLEEEWLQIIEGEQIFIGASENVSSVPVGECIILEMTLPVIHDGQVLYFYSENQEVQVYIDDIGVYSFEMQAGYEFLQTPGSTWNTVHVTEDMSGSTIRIEYTCAFEYYQLSIHDVYLVLENEAMYIRLQEVGIFTLISLVILVLGVVSYVNGYIWKRDKLKNFITNMGDLYTCASLWLLGELNFYDVFFHRPILSYVVSMMMLRILPIVFVNYLSEGLPKRCKIIQGLRILAWINLFLTCFLQFVCGISFLQLLLWNNALIASGGVIILAIYVYSIWGLKQATKMEGAFIANVILVLAGELDVIMYYQYSHYIIVMAGAITVALIVYAIIVHIILLHHETNTDIAKEELERDYKKLQSMALMRQIEAHFIFNTLNTISALCKQDAQEADYAIKLFARYLRSYMYLINQQENIPFESEMELVQAYLEIEKLRFGDAFSFCLEVDEKDFVLPPLSIQPIVENAMIHGLRKHMTSGVITISTKRVSACIIIRVNDNGVGFDVTKRHDQAKDSLGIANIQQRIEYMTNGKIEIYSTIGKGTEVVITLPIQGD